MREANLPNLDENNQLNSELSTRLETAFHSFQSTRDDVFALKSAYNVLQRDIAGLTVSIDKLVSRFEDSKKTNWPLLAMLSGLLPLVIARSEEHTSELQSHSFISYAV